MNNKITSDEMQLLQYDLFKLYNSLSSYENEFKSLQLLNNLREVKHTIKNLISVLNQRDIKNDLY